MKTMARRVIALCAATLALVSAARCQMYGYPPGEEFMKTYPTQYGANGPWMWPWWGSPFPPGPSAWAPSGPAFHQGSAAPWLPPGPPMQQGTPMQQGPPMQWNPLASHMPAGPWGLPTPNDSTQPNSSAADAEKESLQPQLTPDQQYPAMQPYFPYPYVYSQQGSNFAFPPQFLQPDSGLTSTQENATFKQTSTKEFPGVGVSIRRSFGPGKPKVEIEVRTPAPEETKTSSTRAKTTTIGSTLTTPKSEESSTKKSLFSRFYK